MCCNDPSKTDSAYCFFPAHTISPCVFCTGRLRNDLPDVIQAAASRRGENASHCHANRPTADNFDEINDTHSQLAQRHKAHFYNMLKYGGQTVSRCGVMCPVYLIERNCFKSTLWCFWVGMKLQLDRPRPPVGSRTTSALLTFNGNGQPEMDFQLPIPIVFETRLLHFLLRGGRKQPVHAQVDREAGIVIREISDDGQCGSHTGNLPAAEKRDHFG